MAWIDDRIAAHPKFTDISGDAGWTWTKAVAYSSGFGTRGVLSAGQLRVVGATAKVRAELVAAGLWEDDGAGGIRIHDWDDHNSKRDDRRAKDRERKRLQRLQERNQNPPRPQDSPQDVPQDAPEDSPQDEHLDEGEDVRRTDRGQNRGPARVEGSEGSEGSDTYNALGSNGSLHAEEDASPTEPEDDLAFLNDPPAERVITPEERETHRRMARLAVLNINRRAIGLDDLAELPDEGDDRDKLNRFNFGH